jgi:mannobiose 2-epimerase
LSWKPVPNETWLGHNAEVAWIVKKAAHAIKNKEYIIPSKEILIALANNTIERGFDNLYGGIFNRFKNHRPISTIKEWWPQAESVIAFLAAYRESSDKKFLSYAIRLLEYIDNTFCDQQYGEWYVLFRAKAKPLKGYQNYIYGNRCTIMYVIASRFQIIFRIFMKAIDIEKNT